MNLKTFQDIWRPPTVNLCLSLSLSGKISGRLPQCAVQSSVMENSVLYKSWGPNLRTEAWKSA